MRTVRSAALVLLASCCALLSITIRAVPSQSPTAGQPPAVKPQAQPQPAPPPPTGGRKRVLVVGAALGWQHESIPDALVAIYEMGRDTGLWETYIRTDYQLITKGKAGTNAKNLDAFDALVFANTTGEMALDDGQKKDLLAFVHDDGKGFVGVHAALDANYKWPEYGEMIGGWFDEHPWMTFEAPIVLEDPAFPAVKHFPRAFTKRDEIYQAKNWSRDKVNVLLRLDETKLNYENNPRVHRTDRDFAVAWSKLYGKGRVFYSTLGHTPESWVDPDVRTMYEEAVKWVLGLTEGSTATHPKR
jgi:type 1 glutamine amidotransferase